MKHEKKFHLWIACSLVLGMAVVSLSSCGDNKGSVRAVAPPVTPQVTPAETMQSFMIKWMDFPVKPGQSGEFVLAKQDFGGPILLHGLEIHAHPDTTVSSLAEIYVMKGDLPINSAPDQVLGFGGNWTADNPFRAEVLMFPKPIQIKTGTIVVRAWLQNNSSTDTQHETGEVFVYFERQ